MPPDTDARSRASSCIRRAHRGPSESTPRYRSITRAPPRRELFSEVHQQSVPAQDRIFAPRFRPAVPRGRHRPRGARPLRGGVRPRRRLQQRRDRRAHRLPRSGGARQHQQGAAQGALRRGGPGLRAVPRPRPHRGGRRRSRPCPRLAAAGSARRICRARTRSPRAGPARWPSSTLRTIPTRRADLAVFRAQYGLPPCTTANGCFQKVNQTGAASPLPKADTGWAGEISLDLDMVSAACPNCKIILVEANSANMDDLGAAVNEAASLGAAAISNSYGGGEDEPGSGHVRLAVLQPPRRGIITASSSGDSGYGAAFPASSGTSHRRRRRSACARPARRAGGPRGRGAWPTRPKGPAVAARPSKPSPASRATRGCAKAHGRRHLRRRRPQHGRRRLRHLRRQRLGRLRRHQRGLAPRRRDPHRQRQGRYLQ